MSSGPDHFDSKGVVVMGLGRFGGGVGAARWLVGQGAHVTVTDLGDEAALGAALAVLDGLDIEYHLGAHDLTDLDHADLLVVNPAVSKEQSPFFQEALRRSIPWTTEINLFVERCPARIIGVTGTAGKSTTAAMIYAALSGPGTDRLTGEGVAGEGVAGERVAREQLGRAYLGGNVGRSLLSELHAMSADDTVVLELSSFQLADLPKITRRPDLAVMTTVWPNHLDRHGTFEAYLDTKLNMIRGAKAGTSLVLGSIEDSVVDVIVEAAKRWGVSIVRACDRPPLVRVGIVGQHNLLNGQCAAAACSLLGVPETVIDQALQEFRGLPHRLQFVVRRSEIDYYNDSKSTSPKATATALHSFDHPVVILVGGKTKDVALDEMACTIAQRAKVAVCFGEAGPRLHAAIDRARGGNAPPALHRVEHLAEAVEVGRRQAQPGDTVLLSPGFPSFDEFLNYERRGDAFSSLVLRPR